MRYEDLPAKLRAQVDAQIGKQPRGKRSRKVATENTTSEWRCCEPGCGERFTSEAACDAHPHLRIECVLVGTTATALASDQPNPTGGT